LRIYGKEGGKEGRTSTCIERKRKRRTKELTQQGKKAFF
jgi:hypothetical protein